MRCIVKKYKYQPATSSNLVTFWYTANNLEPPPRRVLSLYMSRRCDKNCCRVTHVLSSCFFMQTCWWVLCWASPSPGCVTDSTILHFRTRTATDLCVTERPFLLHRSANWPTPTTSCPCRTTVTRLYPLMLSFILDYMAILPCLVPQTQNWAIYGH